MRLPTKLPNNHQDRLNLGEFYNLNKDKQWFEMAEIIENHPKHMRKTLEVTVNYNPLFEMKEILGFTGKYNLALEIITLSNNDN